ncbi:chemotaxis protein CheA [Gorillibacterium massiliense]|uniref:chemotaxis protein CheA n=1 Tax=Gorillibacterium massiliense TaxID=1280390 RepID=UPI0004B160D8|nr:chemotaxis protein CheA [Gorillibacterium massiliense]
MELNQYLSMFIDESTEHLQAINENLLRLENSPHDIEIVHSIFRSAHTLKGMSATMGFEDPASLTHQMENVLDLVRNGKLSMDPVIFDALFKSADALEGMLKDIVAGGTGKADVTEIVAQLKSIVSGDRKAPVAGGGSAVSAQNAAIQLDEFQISVLEQSLNSGYQVFFVETRLTDECVLKAARAYMVFRVFEESGEVIKSYPSVEDIEQDRFDHSFSVYLTTHKSKESLEKEILNISEIHSVSVNALTKESLRQLSKGTASREIAAAVQAPERGVEKDTAQSVKAQQGQAAGAMSSRTIRVDLERLDNLMNLFSELLISRVRLEQLAGEIKHSDLQETVEHMARTSSELQNIVLKLRMVPVDTVFNRFPRMIRDIAKNLNKKVELIITGADTELDRTVIDEIGDPLVHLLRNAIDHGVESMEERAAANKSENASIYLRAFHSGNHVFIEVEDDGKGINTEKVLETAMKRSIVTREQAAKMSEKDIHQLLFASGFSTADKISDLSGRGVGLDVVKTKIESLGGAVEVESSIGSGTKFIVQLPLTLSIITAMLIRVEAEKYAIPLSSIVETAAITKDKIRKVHGNLLMDYRNTVIPVVPLAEMLEVPHHEKADDSEVNLVIIRKGAKLAALIVDEFIGQQEIVLRSLGKYLTHVFAISGATILGDGQVALIMDTNALIK